VVIEYTHWRKYPFIAFQGLCDSLGSDKEANIRVACFSVALTMVMLRDRYVGRIRPLQGDYSRAIRELLSARSGLVSVFVCVFSSLYYK
jgi:hypothetical protein